MGEASIFGLETDGLLFVEPGAEQVQAMAGEGDIVRWEREQQPLWRSGCTGGRLWIGFEDEVQELREWKTELAAIVGDEMKESRAAFVAGSDALRRGFG